MGTNKTFKIETELLSIKGYTSDDAVKLFIDLDRKEVGSITVKELLALLEPHIDPERVDTGVLEDVVEKLKSERKVKKRRIAKGVLPVVGRPGKVIYLVKKLGGQKSEQVETNEEKFVDHTNLHLFDNITVGQCVARIYPPKEGTPGETAFGDIIPAQVGEEAVLSYDDTLNLIPAEKGKEGSYDLLQSNVEGYLTEQNGKLTIEEELIVRGGLDYSFGSIQFIGSVRIAGDIMPGFSVQAKKGIVVEGSVTMAELVSSKGDITVTDYFHGGSKGKIVCSKDVYVKGLSQTTVEIQGVLQVEQEIRESLIRTESAVIVSQGRLLSGNTYAVNGVEASEVGTKEGIETKIHLCSTVETSTAYHQLVLQIVEHQKAIELISSHLGPYANNPDRLQLLKQPLQSKLQKLFSKLQSVTKSLSSLEEKREKMLEQTYTSDTSRVSVHKQLYDGVKIFAGEKSYEVKEREAGPLSVEYTRATEQLEKKEFSPVEYSREKT